MPLWGWWQTGLFDLDEGFYGAVVREMLRREDWIIPHYNGEPWFEKPILLYWLAAPCVRLFGDDIGPRLPSILASLGLYALIGRFAGARLGPAAGRWSVIVLATSPLMAALGRMMLVDAVFVFFLSAAVVSYYKSFSEPRWRLASGALLGLAVLAKGPVAIILLAGVAVLTYWRGPGLRRTLLDWRPNLLALGCLFAVIAVWYVPAYVEGGSAFVQDFLIKQNLGRFTGGDQAHAVPWYLHLPYYFAVAGLGMLPWSYRVYLGWPKRGESESEFLPFCAHWAIVVVAFFTLSGSKLPHYVLPALFPLAILAGRTLAKPLFGLAAAGWGISLAVALNLVFVFYYRQSGQAEAHALVRWLYTQGGAVVTFQLPRRQNDRGTLRPKIQETSLPSLNFYFDRPLVHAETLDQLANAPKPAWVFTREDRLAAGDLVRLRSRGLKLEAVRAPGAGEHYLIYRLSHAEDGLIRD